MSNPINGSQQSTSTAVNNQPGPIHSFPVPTIASYALHRSRHFAHKHLQNPYTREKVEGVMKGVLLTFAVPVAMNPLSKFESIIQISSGNVRFWSTFIDKPFKGLPSSILFSGSKNLLIFGGAPFLEPYLKAVIEKKIKDPDLNLAASSAVIAAATSVLFAPTNTLRTRLYTDPDCKSLSCVIKKLPPETKFRSSFKGLSAYMTGEMVFWFPFSYVLQKIQAAQPKDLDLAEKLGYNIFAGGFAGAFCSRFCYPFGVMASRLRVSNHSISLLKLFIKTLREDPHAFSRGWARTAVPRSFIAGAVTNIGSVLVDKALSQISPPKSSVVIEEIKEPTPTNSPAHP